MSSGRRNLTTGSVFGNLMYFSVPYLIACFLQTFYGLADLYITGRFNAADSITGVAVGSQVMHMLTVMVIGLVMGTTVTIGRGTGKGDSNEISKSIGNSIVIFACLAIALTAILQFLTDPILAILKTPTEALSETKAYLKICFWGVPLIVAYNVMSGIFRGLGDSTRPMVFVFISGVINIFLDWLFIGPMERGAAGAAWGTVIAQAVSVVLAFLYLVVKSGDIFSMRDIKPDRVTAGEIFRIGLPIMLQDGLIQVSFLIFTAIANNRGVDIAAAVGVVEKIITFMFLVQSAMLSSVSSIVSQCAGTGDFVRAKKTLWKAIEVSVIYNACVVVLCELFAPGIVGIFAGGEAAVVVLGAQYLRSYIFDGIFTSFHFCMSGYFAACGKSHYSFIHNILSVALFRIPIALWASKFFPDNLFPMGLAAPIGSAFSVILCVWFYRRIQKSTAPAS